jgi:Flp pilus assembly pilin Flp
VILPTEIAHVSKGKGGRFMKDVALKWYVRGLCAKERALARMSRSLKDKRGATVVEYVVLAGFAAVLGIAIVRLFWGAYAAGGGGIGQFFYQIIEGDKGLTTIFK